MDAPASNMETKTITLQEEREKICVVCKAPFSWKKKWERCWGDVITCSQKCNSDHKIKIKEGKELISSRNRDENDDEEDGVLDNDKITPKQSKRDAKSLTRAKREGLDSTVGRKPCTVCGTNADLLIRCQIDKSKRWNMVCGSCWKEVSGGVTDGDADHPHYRYGGVWKNK